MGLLDDAIREHLELKRRHGANPSEIADLEREAFGPGRRAPEPLEVPDETPAVAPEPEVPAADAEPEVLEPPVADMPVADAPAPVLPREPEPPPPPAAAPPEPRPPEEIVADVEDEDVVPEAEGEDVLEETPEFLQETPEHDRLWFEQRPPRDFDFDG
jgi:hypothetical protein